MRRYLLCLLLSLMPPTVQAVVVKQGMRPGIAAEAEYLIGERGQPAVLLVHGFLQTREFPTVATLARGLQDEGYTVLSPTLSLNIPARTRSLACEAVHRHSLDDDVAEIGRWISWLRARGHTTIVLLGHSFGSLQLLAYLSSKPDPAVKGYLGASLVDAQLGTASRPAVLEDLEGRVARGERGLITRPLSFCKRYTSTPADFLSYARWDQARVLAVLKQPPVRLTLVMGDADTVLDHGWLKALQHVQAPMAVVRGANHFMDGEHEFDLLEHSLTFLAQFRAVGTP